MVTSRVWVVVSPSLLIRSLSYSEGKRPRMNCAGWFVSYRTDSRADSGESSKLHPNDNQAERDEDEKRAGVTGAAPVPAAHEVAQHGS